MRLYLDVTWPVCKTVGPLQRSNQLANLLHNEMGMLRQDLVRHCGDRFYIHGLFGCDNKVPDVDRYVIVGVEHPRVGCAPSRQACAISVTPHQIARAVPTQSNARGRRSPFVSTYPYIDRLIEFSCDRPSLVIVLESPHRDEYGGSVQAPIAPARGPTGAGIHKYLCKLLNSCTQMMRLLLDRAPVRVVISNPIPFQTSAYAIDGGKLSISDRLRNFIWAALWCMHDDTGSKCFQEAFFDKLAEYTPIAIVNACTSGGNPNRRSEITRVIQARFGCCDDRRVGIPIYETDHPSTWGPHTRLKCVEQRNNG